MRSRISEICVFVWQESKLRKDAVTYTVMEEDGEVLKSPCETLHDRAWYAQRLNRTTNIVATDGDNIRPLTDAEDEVVGVLKARR